MLDSTTQGPVTVSIDGDAGPYIMVPLDKLEAVQDLLRSRAVPFWLDADAISLNGRLAIAVVNLGRAADARQVQQYLDAAA